MTQRADATGRAWQTWKWLSWAGLALAVSPWGCGGTTHEQSGPSNQGGAPGGAGAFGTEAGQGVVITDAGYPGYPGGYQGGVITVAGDTGYPFGGAPSAGAGGAPTAINCDGTEITITTQADADLVSGCPRLNGVYVAGVADPLVIDWPSLTTLNGELHFARAAKLTRISLRNLRQINGELYLKGNAALQVVELPGLVKISGDPDLNSAILVEDNPRLTTFLVSADLRVKGLTSINGSPLLCDAANLGTLIRSNALYPGSFDLPACAYPDIGAAGAGGSF
jgi:hypothetical protein